MAVITACAVLVLLIVFSPYILQFVWSAAMIFVPFVAAYLVSLFATKLADMIKKRFRIPTRLAAVLVIIIIVGVLGGIIGAVLWKIIDEFKQIYENFPAIYENISDFWNNLTENMSDIAEQMPDWIRQSMDSLYAQFMQGITNLVKDMSIFRTAGNGAKRLPSILISTITFILSLYFMISDSQYIRGFLRRHIPETIFARMKQLKTELKRYVGGYVKAQMILMSFAFIILLAGMLVLRVNYALIIALAIALLDALPFFGSGAVLIPWSLMEFFTGSAARGVGFLIVYLSVLLMRQLIEPKIVGENIGIHPLLTLMSMYAGYRIFSVGGLILGPLTLTLFISFYNVGAFNGIIIFIKGVLKAFLKELKNVVNSVTGEDD